MDTETQTVNLPKSWVSAHPRVVIGVIVVVCLSPFINKAIHTDDVLFVRTAQWIQKHPADFYGFDLNYWFTAIPMWRTNWNPPLMSYFLAGVGALFGWSEIVLHLAGLAIAGLAALGIYALAQKWCQWPLLAAVVAILTPSFLVSSSTLMCDVLMLALWTWALVFWEQALSREQSRWPFIGAGVLAGLAVLTKYSAITLLPLFPVLSILRARKSGWCWLGMAVPLIMLAAYEWTTAEMYGRGLFSVAASHTHDHREFPGAWGPRGIIGLAFAGGCTLPVLCFAPWLWRPKALLAGGVAVAGLWLAMFPLWNHLGLINSASLGAPEIYRQWPYLLQVALLTAGGLQLLLLIAADVWQRRDVTSVALALWIGGGLFSATVLNFAINGRSMLLIVPATAILLVRRLAAARGAAPANGRLLWPLIPAAAITLSAVIADCQLANSDRTAAEKIVLKYMPAGRQLWFEGHALQYYMEKLGGRPIDVQRSLLQPGDIVVVPESGTFSPLPAGSVGWVDHLQNAPFSWMNLMGATGSGAAGFYGANWGPIPFHFGALPVQGYCLVKVLVPMQFNSQPANRQSVQAGDVPGFPVVTFQPENTATFARQPEVLNQARLAAQLKAEGKIAEAIRQYRYVLSLDSNNPVVLNNLARLLITADKPELRNGKEAVQLAAQAVELTHCSQPVIVGTLAAAYAQTGQFAQACEMAQIARALAWMTNQKELSAEYNRLAGLYYSGNAAPVSDTPNDNQSTAH
jgi:4-amino-4-deoxy-L-arabinose transferase-like glycosyltransferase